MAARVDVNLSITGTTSKPNAPMARRESERERERERDTTEVKTRPGEECTPSKARSPQAAKARGNV